MNLQLGKNKLGTEKQMNYKDREKERREAFSPYNNKPEAGQ